MQSLADDTSFNVNFEALKAGFDKIVPAAELESTIEDSREIFLGQLRNIDRPIEQLSAEHAPTAQPETPISAPQELVRPPEPTVTMRPIESQALAQPPTLEPSIEPQPFVQPPVEPQSTIQPPTEPAPVEQTQPVVPPEPEQPPNLPEPKVELTPESIVVEQQETAPPSSGETDVQMREHESAEVSVPTNEDEAKAPEVTPKKKSFGQRLRKSVMGY